MKFPNGTIFKDLECIWIVIDQNTIKRIQIDHLSQNCNYNVSQLDEKVSISYVMENCPHFPLKLLLDCVGIYE